MTTEDDVPALPWFECRDNGAPPASDFVVRSVDEPDRKVAAVVVKPMNGALAATWRDSTRCMWLVVPAKRLQQGKKYRFEFVGKRAPPPRVSSVEVAIRDEVARIDHGTATLRTEMPVQAPIKVATGIGICSITLQASQAKVHLVLPPAAERFGGALLMRTAVDGKEWRPTSGTCDPIAPGMSWMGPLREMLFAPCPGQNGPGQDLRYVPVYLAEGTHEVVMTAWLPGTDMTWSARGTIDLRCRK